MFTAFSSQTVLNNKGKEASVHQLGAPIFRPPGVVDNSSGGLFYSSLTVV